MLFQEELLYEKICIIHSGPRKKNTYATVEKIKQSLLRQGEVSFTEFFLPHDAPCFCTGCFACILKGRELCPHRAQIAPIEQAMLEADGLIFSTPVYVMDMSGQMKAFLDHFGHCFTIHRPFPELFQKSALVVTTAAGAGNREAAQSIRRVLSYWGISKLFEFGIAMRAASWDDIPPERSRKLQKKLDAAAVRFFRSLDRPPHPGIRFRLMFRVMRAINQRNPDGHIDKEYWRAQGWLNGGCPWKS